MLLELILTTKQLMVIIYMGNANVNEGKFYDTITVSRMFKGLVISLTIKVEYLMMDMDRYGLKKSYN